MSLISADGLNRSAQRVFMDCRQRAAELGIEAIELDCGTQVLDFGVRAPAGLAAGLEMASICLAGRARVNLVGGDRQLWPGPWIQVATDQPAVACMLAQYAGWPVKLDSFFAMGSGAMRVRRGQEPLLQSLSARDSQAIAVGTLECDRIPNDSLAEHMAAQCQVEPRDLCLAVAPTRSVAGCAQVVARSVETAMHKLHDLEFPLEAVRNAYGLAPLCPPTPDFALGIGRTNDAILYGAHVSLWMDADDDLIQQVGAQLPSQASQDFGRPFAEIFAQYDSDFYKIDPGLFSPAEVLLMSVRSGRSWKFGGQRADLIAQSFGTEAA